MSKSQYECGVAGRGQGPDEGQSAWSTECQKGIPGDKAGKVGASCKVFIDRIRNSDFNKKVK